MLHYTLFFFYLSKAFDRVSRYLLLKALVKMGVGSVMLNTLKCIYSSTLCILKGFGKLSDIFQTFTGIKQGASSSVILFIAFLDDIIDILKCKCAPEQILGDLHCLLHTDDKMLLSTNRELFMIKCNILIDTIKNKKMSLNYSKSGYMIINPKQEDLRSSLKLNHGWLNYKTCQKYLGVLIMDTGNLRDDIEAFIASKNKEVCVKLANFVRKNDLAPVMIKLKVVNACINSSITYSSETWSSYSLNNVESLQCKAIKIALGIRSNTANEITYVESGFKPIKAMICKRQLKFFRKFKNSCFVNPTAPTSKIFSHAMDKNISFLRHHKQIDAQFDNPEKCYQHYIAERDKMIVEKITVKHSQDTNSILGTYYRINPSLKSPVFYNKPLCFESNRITITKFRTGSHHLRIQTGRTTEENHYSSVTWTYKRLSICCSHVPRMLISENSMIMQTLTLHRSLKVTIT